VVNDTFFAGARKSDDVTIGFALYNFGFLSARCCDGSSVNVVDEDQLPTGDFARRYRGGLKHLTAERAADFKRDEVMLSTVLEFAFVQIPQPHVRPSRPMLDSVRPNLAH
jgi:hypothetical protein